MIAIISFTIGRVTAPDAGESGTRNTLSGGVSGNVVQAGTVGEVHIHAHPRAVTVPSQLPAAPARFAGREHELRDLSEWRSAASGQLLTVISGPGGVGKTALALRWLHQSRDDYPGGQLYVDLGGFSLAEPISPADVLEWFLLAFGVDAIPAALPQREALYRSVTADLSMVVFLDNAASAAQVRPLLPASPNSVVVVTSRWRLTGLAMAGARIVDVTPLDVDASMALLGQAVDRGRVAAEPGAVRELAELCDGLPLALSLVGARLATHPRRRLSREVTDLRAEQHRIAALRADDSSVGAVFDLSCRSVPPAAGRLYRLVASHPGTRFGPQVAAAAIDSSVADAEDLLDVLVEANMLSEVDDRTYRFHDLMRLHARQQPDDGRDSAVRRMIEWYLDTTTAADLLFHPLPQRIGPRYQGERPTSPLFDTPAAALAWLSAERLTVWDAVHEADRRDWHDLTWEFAEALWGFLRHVRHQGDSVDLHRLALRAAKASGNRQAETRMHGRLSLVYADNAQYAEAIAEADAELAIATAEGYRWESATALTHLAHAVSGTGDLASALGYYERSRDLNIEIDNARGVAMARRRIGEVLIQLDRPADAIVELVASADALAALHDDTQHARSLMYLGTAYARTAEPARAAEPLRTALELVRAIGSAYYQAEVLAMLGDLAERSGDLPAAREHFRAALDHYVVAGDAKADRMRDRLSALA